MPFKDQEFNRGYQRRRMKTNRRLKRLRAIEFLGGRCYSCEITDPALLEFSHELGPKEITADRLWALGWDKILVEIKKCRLRCQSCHASIDPYRAGPAVRESIDESPGESFLAQTYDDEIPF